MIPKNSLTTSLSEKPFVVSGKNDEQDRRNTISFGASLIESEIDETIQQNISNKPERSSRRNSLLLFLGIPSALDYQVVPVDGKTTNESAKIQSTPPDSVKLARRRSLIRIVSGVTNVPNIHELQRKNIEEELIENGSAKTTSSSKNRHIRTLLGILQDPIQCGYLLQFTTLEHNSENLSFVMMVSRFRETMNCDVESWPKRWTQIDKEIHDRNENEIVANTTWPSKKLLKPAIELMAQSIWNEFLDENANSEISMSSTILTNTKRRLVLLDLYGPEVFSEALTTPIETINQDILPRFLRSTHQLEMENRIRKLSKNVPDSVIKFQPNDNPLISAKQRHVRFNDKYTLEETLHNRTLYDEYLKYLKTKSLSKYLLCKRMIVMFKDLCMLDSQASSREATDIAWSIYEYFIANDSPYEMSLPSIDKKEIMVALANNHIQMFDALETHVMSKLNDDFQSYNTPEQFEKLKALTKKSHVEPFLSILKRTKR